MPIYEYICEKCKNEFEALVSSGVTPECPKCQSTKLKRKLSTFAAKISGPASCANRHECPAASAHNCGCGCGCHHH